MLAHYSNLPIDLQNAEPVYDNLFEVVFTFPETIGLGNDEVNMMMLNTTSINVDTTKDLKVHEQRFKYSGRLYLGTETGNSTIKDLKLDFNINMSTDTFSMNTWNYMKKWYDLAWNSQNGTLHYKRDMIGDMVVSIHSRTGKVIRRVEYKNVQVKRVSEQSYSWTNESIIAGSVNVVSDYWIDSYFDL